MSPDQRGLTISKKNQKTATLANSSGLDIRRRDPFKLVLTLTVGELCAKRPACSLDFRRGVRDTSNLSVTAL